jgi:hypothetical protein
MLSGFNTNVRHRGVLFHVQTEDSGREHPHIITHVFHGGTILASEKSSYADRLGEPELLEVVRGLMETQHRVVVQRLRAGVFDEATTARLGPDVFAGAAPAVPERRASETAPTARAAEGGAHAAPQRSFGEGIVSDRPLDEVILAYLVENARKRKRT